MSPFSLSEKIENRIYLIRGLRVMLDADLARIYGVEVKQLKRQVRRNAERFPSDFMFALTQKEYISFLRCQIGTLEQGVYSKYPPYAFTEHGAVMLAGVLKSPLAVQASIIIARAFVMLRRTISAHKELARVLARLERRIEGHDADIEYLFNTLRKLMEQPEAPPLKIRGIQP